MVSYHSFRAIYELFVVHPRASTLPPPLNGRLLSALYELEPGVATSAVRVEHTSLRVCWLQTLEAGVVCLLQNDIDLGLAHAIAFAQRSLDAMLGGFPGVKNAAFFALKVGMRILYFFH